jgi:23S rRNA pseudoU1915 N3-methylase RlmH
MEVSQYNLTQKQEKAIIALLTEPTIKQAALTAGIGETTLFRWLQEEEFDQAYKKARRQALSQTISRLQQASTSAVVTLQTIMEDENATSSSRVSAAKTVLEMSFKAFETEELAAQIEELQQRIEEAEGR